MKCALSSGVAIVSLAASFSLASGTLGSNMVITKEHAIEIADREAMRLGYDTKVMNMEIDEQNTKWSTYILSTPSALEGARELKDALKKRKYWAVYYGPKGLVLGGDIFIFIDRDTGEILGVLRGR